MSEHCTSAVGSRLAAPMHDEVVCGPRTRSGTLAELFDVNRTRGRRAADTQPDCTDTSTALRVRVFTMIVPFTNRVSGATVYINPDYVVSVRPDPADPDNASVVKLRDGETIKVQGALQDVADRLLRVAA